MWAIQLELKLRITPIYMGSTSVGHKICSLHQDHPHIHGEHWLTRMVRLEYLGSPPYTWGALVQVLAVTTDLGITPIYMGSTALNRCIRIIFEDHPHIHGEHCLRL